MYCIFPVLARIITKIMRVPAHLRGTYMCMFIFSNNTFMGYPVVQALFGTAPSFISRFLICRLISCFLTLALYYFQKDAAIEAHNLEKMRVSVRSLINNGIIASVAALVIYFTNLQMPDIFYSCVGFIGDITTPLSMIIIGSSMAAASLKRSGQKRGSADAPHPSGAAAADCLGVHAPVDRRPCDHQYLHHWRRHAGGIPGCHGSAPYPRQNKAASIGVVISTLVSLITIPIMAVLLGAS